MGQFKIGQNGPFASIVDSPPEILPDNRLSLGFFRKRNEIVRLVCIWRDIKRLEANILQRLIEPNVFYSENKNYDLHLK